MMLANTALHGLGELLWSAAAVVPLWGARLLFLAVPIALMAWVVQWPDRQTTPADGSAKWSNNLKLWAWLILLLQVVAYSAL